MFQTAQITLAAVGDVLQRAVFLCSKVRMRGADLRQHVLKVTSFGNCGNAVGGKFLGKCHTHIM